MTTSVDDDKTVTVELDEYGELLYRYEQAKERAQQAKAEAEDLRQMVMKLLPGEDEAPDGVVVTVAGVPRLSYKPYGTRQLAVAKLRDLYPTIAAECTDWVVRWRLTTPTQQP